MWKCVREKVVVRSQGSSLIPLFMSLKYSNKIFIPLFLVSTLLKFKSRLCRANKKVWVWRNKNAGMESQIADKSEQHQRACKTHFDDCLQWSQMSSMRICRHHKFLVGIASRQKRHIKFLNLLGMAYPHINFQTLLSWGWISTSSLDKFSLARILDYTLTYQNWKPKL